MTKRQLGGLLLLSTLVVGCNPFGSAELSRGERGLNGSAFPLDGSIDGGDTYGGGDGGGSGYDGGIYDGGGGGYDGGIYDGGGPSDGGGGGPDGGDDDDDDCAEGTGNAYNGKADPLGDDGHIKPPGPIPALPADVMNGHKLSACNGYDIFGNVGATGAGAKDGNCHNASLTAGTTGAIVCGGNPFLGNADPIAMAGNHTASWDVIKTGAADAPTISFRFYSWSGITAGGKNRYWTYRMPPGTKATDVPDLKNNSTLFANPKWPTGTTPNGTNVYIAGTTNQGWIQAESYNDTPLGNDGFCEGQFKAGTSYAMTGSKDMENPGPKIACTWLDFKAGRKSKNPNADCKNLCEARSKAWPGWDHSAAFKTACESECDTCLPAKPACPPAPNPTPAPTPTTPIPSPMPF